MAKLILDIWSGPYAVSESFLSYSTLAHNLISPLRSKIDYENKTRFRSARPNTHSFSFLVWRDSIQLRYYIKSVIILIMAALLSYNIVMGTAYLKGSNELYEEL